MPIEGRLQVVAGPFGCLPGGEGGVREPRLKRRPTRPRVRLDERLQVLELGNDRVQVRHRKGFRTRRDGLLALPDRADLRLEDTNAVE